MPSQHQTLKYSGNSLFIGSWHKIDGDKKVDNLVFSIKDDGSMDVYYRYGHSGVIEESAFDIQVNKFPFWGDEREFLMEPFKNTVAVREVQKSGAQFMWYKDEDLNVSDPVNIVLKSDLWLVSKQREAKK